MRIDIFKHLTIVNFNYDRCVEHFLFHAIQAWSLKHERDIAELMKGLKIYHPYGSVGDLPWQSEEGIEFGAEADELGLLESSSRIWTFNEEVEDNTKIRKILSSATRIIFLGFHFHPQNMDLMKAPNAHTSTANKQAYATAIARLLSDQTLIQTQISQLGCGTIHIKKDWDCLGLFREFGTTWLG